MQKEKMCPQCKKFTLIVDWTKKEVKCTQCNYNKKMQEGETW